jgi:peptide/nickel transport system substrate-binding protein
LKNVLIAIVLGGFCFEPALSAGAPAPIPKRGGIARFGLDSDVLSVNPFQRTLSITKGVGSIAFECLLAMDRNGDLKPALATGWDVSKDGLTYNFKLRRGVKFHNGKEMTAEDVIWAIEYAKDPKNAACGKDRMQSIASVTAPDSFTLRIVLKEIYVPFLPSLSTGFDTFPVIPKGSVPFGSERLSMYPPGTGPFMMTEYRPGQLLVFKRFDRYWQNGLPYLAGVEFKVIEDTTIRFTALRTGELDVASRIGYEQALRIRKGEFKDLGLEYTPTSGYRAWIFNTEARPFSNVKLRQAVAYAIDRAKIIEGVSFGLGNVHDQKVAKTSRWYVPLKGRVRDLAKAKALLKEAGYPDGLRVNVRVSRGWPNSEVTQIIQNHLKEVGIQVDIELIDFAKSQEEFRSGEFEMAPVGGAMYVDPDLAYYQYFHTDTAPMKISNFPRYSNLRVDRLLEQGRREPDFKKRYQIYKEAVEIIEDEAPQIVLGFNPYLFGYRNNVKDFKLQTYNDDYNYVVGGLVVTWMDR